MAQDQGGQRKYVGGQGGLCAQGRTWNTRGKTEGRVCLLGWWGRRQGEVSREC